MSMSIAYKCDKCHKYFDSIKECEDHIKKCRHVQEYVAFCSERLGFVINKADLVDLNDQENLEPIDPSNKNLVSELPRADLATVPEYASRVEYHLQVYFIKLDNSELTVEDVEIIKAYLKKRVIDNCTRMENLHQKIIEFTKQKSVSLVSLLDVPACKVYSSYLKNNKEN